MQDHIRQIDETPCTARPDHTLGPDCVKTRFCVGHFRTSRRALSMVRFAPDCGHGADIPTGSLSIDVLSSLGTRWL
jgi:hypothetical protein